MSRFVFVSKLVVSAVAGASFAFAVGACSNSGFVGEGNSPSQPSEPSTKPETPVPASPSVEVQNAANADAKDCPNHCQNEECKAGAKNDEGDSKSRVTIDVQGAPTLGSVKAPVTLVVFSDFECPFCARSSKTERALVEAYGGNVRLVFKNRPLPFHTKARGLAELALAADSFGKFWETHDSLFAEQGSEHRASAEGHAKTLGIDPKAYERAVRDSRVAARIEADSKEAERLDVRGVPTYFVNGRRITGAQSESAFRSIIDEELAALEH